MENSLPTQSRAITIYNIMGTNNVESNSNDAISRASSSQTSRPTAPRRNSIQANNRRMRDERRRNLTELHRQKITSIFCLFGVFATVIGAGMVMVFLVAEYSVSLQQMINYRNLVIPGFLLLFLGIFALIIGIYFCWIHKRTDQRVRYINRNDELEAGFHQNHGRNRGYANHSMVPDEPPLYEELPSTFLPVVDSGSIKLPSYADALKLYEITKTSKSETTPFTDRTTLENQPPPYSNDPSTS